MFTSPAGHLQQEQEVCGPGGGGGDRQKSPTATFISVYSEADGIKYAEYSHAVKFSGCV